MGENEVKPIKVLFVGGFRETTADGAVGGSLVAARSLVSSGIARHVEWILLDTTMRSVPAPPLPIRAAFAARRMLHFVGSSMGKRADVVLIFAGGGSGFIEKAAMALVASAAGKPVLFSPRAGSMRRSLGRSRILRTYAKRALARCDRIVCQGDTWKQFYRDLTGLPETRFVSIANWINAREYAERVPKRSADGPVFLFLGWVERAKGILDLIRAVRRERARLGKARFVVCGRGGAWSEAQALCQELGVGDQFVFKGWVHGEEKRTLLTSSDALVLPSYAEGMPNAVLEAMAAGLAVVASRVGAIPDLVEDGRSGLLVDAGDVEALGRALVRLAEDPPLRAELGQAARDKVLRDHDIERAWPRLLEVMREALEDRRSRRSSAAW